MLSWTVERARVAALSRSRPVNDPDLLQARRNLKLARLADHVDEAMSSWPPISAEQRAELADRLTSPRAGLPGGAA